MSGLRAFGLVSTSIWQSNRFTSLERLDARLAYIWLHTSSKTSAGILRIGPAHLFEETDFIDSLDRASEVFEELSDAKLIQRHRPYVVLNKYITHNPVKTYKHAIGAFNEALAMPEGEAKTRPIEELEKQRGAMELARWRDKSGEPHPVLFDIHSYMTERSIPPDTLSNTISDPLCRSRIDKGERRIPNDETTHPDRPSDMQRKPQGASVEALRSRLARGF